MGVISAKRFSKKSSGPTIRTRVNRQIRVPEVRVVDDNGDQIGVVATQEAMDMAQQKGLDLVEVAPNVKPPVCRIMDFSRYKYEQEKKQRLAKKKQKVIHVKELKYTPRIEEHDYQVKFSNLEKFLKRGDKVKIRMFFKGRQRAHVELGQKIMDRLVTDSAGFAEVVEHPKLEGRAMTMILKAK